jgi:hypothetical protein
LLDQDRSVKQWQFCLQADEGFIIFSFILGGLIGYYVEIVPEQNLGNRSAQGGRRMILDVLETLVLSVVLFLGINAVSARIRVESISMQPNLYAGDFVIVNKLAYKLGIPQRGDIIVFRYPPDPTQTPYIERDIGLSGDQIHIADGRFMSMMMLVEPYQGHHQPRRLDRAANSCLSWG